MLFEDPLSLASRGNRRNGISSQNLEKRHLWNSVSSQVLEGLVLSFDYLEIDISDAILSVSSQNIVDKCYDSPT